MGIYFVDAFFFSVFCVFCGLILSSSSTSDFQAKLDFITSSLFVPFVSSVVK